MTRKQINQQLKNGEIKMELLFENKNQMGGYIHQKYSVINQVQSSINVLDLGVIPQKKTEDVIFETIISGVKKGDFPIRVITNNNSDKIIILNNVMKKFKKLKMMSLDINNPFTFTIVRKGRDLLMK
ncbi:hypothetical protein N9N24_01210 [Candidatus Marinimicrobia bacterium]|nr:hypothetical protein [Candidatus Neomarinimicrobiota bacterium]|tara:strand:- start:37 stop:417 length:381 start_codon:yes stop_codon:yes gene_type:complete